MKIAFDENIPPQMVRIFLAQAGTNLALGHEIVSAQDYRPIDEHGDENWLGRFAADGGNVIISGDKRIRVLPHERAALTEGGLIAYFFHAQWNNSDFHTKSAMLIKRWPQIVQHMTAAPAGSCWEIPFDWTFSDLKDVSANPAEITKDRPKKRKKKQKKKQKDAEEEPA